VNTRIVLSASAIVLGAAGVAAIFAPQEILAAMSVGDGGMLPVMMQLLGTVWFAFALMNWTARGSLIGGIYNRPVAIANLAHFMVGALALAKAAARTPAPAPLLMLTTVYVVLAIAFGLVFFRSPVRELAETA
jgi:quinol-cytochrome oxidoreductase complex cytochrome b subunit